MNASGPPRYEARSRAERTRAAQPANVSAAKPTVVTATVAAQRPTLLVRSGANSLLVGLMAGLLGGLVGVSLTWLVASEASNNTRLVVLATIVPSCLGALLSGWFDLSAKAWTRGAERAVIGAAVGGAAGAIGFGLADLVFGLVEDRNEDLALLVGWVIVSSLIGLGIGAYRSYDKARTGTVGGALGGVAGGLVLLALGVDQYAPYGETLLAVTLAAIAVGLAIGGLERVSRDLWIEVLDGPLAGREFPVDKSTVLIGSAPHCQISMGIDSKIEPRHAQLTIANEQIIIEPIDGAVRLNGRNVTGRVVVTDEQITVGGSHLAIRR